MRPDPDPQHHAGAPMWTALFDGSLTPAWRHTTGTIAFRDIRIRAL